MSNENIKTDAGYYDSCIIKFEGIVAEANIYDILFGDSTFLSIYESPKDFLDLAIKALGSTDKGNEYKKIVVCTMQKLPLDDYIYLVTKCDRYYLAKTLPESVLIWAIAPNFSKRQILTRNYSNLKVRKLLIGLRKIGHLSANYNELIDGILSGRLAGWLSGRPSIRFL